MTRFIKKSMVFLGLMLILNFGLFLFTKYIYHNDYGEPPSHGYRSFLLADSHGLALGSHTEAYGTYNFSAASECYVDMKIKLTYLLNEGYPIDTLYLTVDDHTLSPYRLSANNTDRSSVYGNLEDFSGPYDFFVEKYFRFYLPIFQPKALSIAKSYFLEQIRKSKFGGSKSTPDNLWSDMNAGQRRNKAKIRFKRQFPSSEASKELSIALHEIIKTCEDNDITVVGIKFPLSSVYLEVVQDTNYGADSILLSYGYPVLDYKYLYTEQDDFFKNQDHMSDAAGKLFTDYFFQQHHE